MGDVFDYLTTTALSITVSGNTGVAPFATLFIVGLIERIDPTLLAMEGWTETLLSSWWSLVIFGGLTILEFVGKCVPVVDEIIDSAEVFIVPIFSILGSLATFGLFNLAQEPDDSSDGSGSRELGAAGDGMLTFVKVVLCLFGIGLALLVHLFKMLIRLMGEGCLTCCITTAEYTWITISLLLAILIKPIALVVAVVLIGSAVYGFIKRRKVWKTRREEGGSAEAEGGAAGTNTQPPPVPAQKQQTATPQEAIPINDAAINNAKVGQLNGEDNVTVGVVQDENRHDEENAFPAYNPDDFDERPPAVAPAHHPVVTD